VVTRVRIPEEVLSAAHERAAARAAKDWPEADRIRAEIEAAGWKVVDRGTDFALEPAHALARVMDLAPQKPGDHLMVVNLSGRGDKDLASVAEYLDRRGG
jgi:tryptophan synthase beta subunit